MITCVKVRALFAKNKVRFARAEQLCFWSTQPADTPHLLSISAVLHCNLLVSNFVRRSNLAQAAEYPAMRNLFLLTYYRHWPMDARKRRCRILLAASEPVAYRLVSKLVINCNSSSQR